MRVATSPNSLWRLLIWPALWPMLLAQALLIALCALAWLVLWRTEGPDSPGVLASLLLVLMIGTVLIVATFLLLLRHRLRQWEISLGVPYERLERLVRDVHKQIPPWMKPRRLMPPRRYGGGPVARLESLLDGLEALLERLAEQPQVVQMVEKLPQPAFLARQDVLVEANTAFESIIGRSLGELRGLEISYLIRRDDSDDACPEAVRVHDGRGAWQTFRLIAIGDDRGYCLGLLDDLNDQQQRLARITLSRNQAREESRLKTRYLGVLRDELQMLVDDLGARDWLDEALRERLAGLGSLLAHLTEAPADESATPLAANGKEAQAQSPGALDSARVLVVDDGPVNAMLARQVLEAQGARVDTAVSGTQALQLGDEHHYDLVFMDIFMPGPDGMETSRLWREREAQDPHGRRSVLIALTANAGDDDRERYFDAGMNDFLAKPYSPQALIDTALHWWANQRTNRKDGWR